MRIGKILLVFGMGVFLALAAFNNITMSAGGYGAVAAAVGMETTFQPPGAMWRAITSPALIWLGFAVIVIGELVGAIYCLWGAGKLWSARASAEAFNGAKPTAMLGLTITAVLYFVGFHAVAQEWFLMWQSTEMNVLQDAFRNFASAVLLMLWINSEDK
jgi:predicted small integral membrane protein